DKGKGNDQFSGLDHISPEKLGTPSTQTSTLARHLASTHLDHGSSTTGMEGQVDHRVKRAHPDDEHGLKELIQELSMWKKNVVQRAKELDSVISADLDHDSENEEKIRKLEMWNMNNIQQVEELETLIANLEEERYKRDSVIADYEKERIMFRTRHKFTTIPMSSITTSKQHHHNNAPSQDAMSKSELQRRVTELEKGTKMEMYEERIEELIQTNQDLTNANRDLVKTNQELIGEDTRIQSGLRALREYFEEAELRLDESYNKHLHHVEQL
ncbi:hypothetical protein CPB97_010867, partial [Podila verticillata]